MGDARLVVPRRAALRNAGPGADFRNLAAAVTATVIAFAYLEIMTNEPMHPGGLLAAMAAIGAAGGAWAIARGRTDGLTAGAGLPWARR